MKAIKNAFLALLFLISSSAINGNDLSGSKVPIYLHTDRSYYISGESILFKAYIFDTPKENTNQANDTLRVTLIDQYGVVVANGQFPLDNSLINGKIDLPDILTEGNYLLFAYKTKNKEFSPEKTFSKVIEIMKSENPELLTDLSLADTIYESGSTLNAQIKFSDADNKPVSASFSYHLTSDKGEILSGKGKADNEGKSTLKLKLPAFDNKETYELIVEPLSKGNRSATGIIIPTPFNHIVRKNLNSGSYETGEQKHLNIQLKTSLQDEKVQLDIAVTDDQGKPVMANLSVSASNILPQPAPGNDMTDYTILNNKMKESDKISDINSFYAQYLVHLTQSPGIQFTVQKKNDIKKLRRKEVSSNQKKQEGYSADRNIMDIIMQLKPYHIDNGKIVFGISSVNTINGQEGALIVIDGVKMGTDIGVLTNLSVPDIAHIYVSTNIMDIQKYSAMNNVGVIEITLKKNKSFENKEETTGNNSYTLFWGPDIITDNSGNISLNFANNNKSGSILISVDGITAKGSTGSKTQVLKVK